MIEYNYQNRVAVVTGGSSGIGLATVRMLLTSGANVAFCARNKERLYSVANELKQEFGTNKVFVSAFDILDEIAVTDFAENIKTKYGRVDLLVTNAGQGRVSTFESTTNGDWREEFDLKLFSQIYPIRAFQLMLEKAKGSIVAVNSLLAYQPEPHMVCTSAARASVQSLLKSLSIEFAPNVRVNSILLGLIISGQWKRRFESREDRAITFEAWLKKLAQEKNIPLQRLGNPDEAAAAILFLGSSSAGYITGAQIDISGGLSKTI